MFSALCERWQCKRDRAGITGVPEAAFCSMRCISQDNGSLSTTPVNNKGTSFAQWNVEQPFQLWIQCGQHWLCWSAGERREAAGCCWGPWVLWLHTSGQLLAFLCCLPTSVLRESLVSCVSKWVQQDWEAEGRSCLLALPGRGLLPLLCLFALWFIYSGCLNLMLLSCQFLSLVLIGFFPLFFPSSSATPSPSGTCSITVSI